MEKVKRYWLDPDYRKEPPKEGLFCIRCQKPIDDIEQAKPVTQLPGTHDVIEGGNELLGRDCWKFVKKHELK